MQPFQYEHGDKPLEGYTILRAAGRGGFGEVYYAVSDSGREVALKVVQTYEQIELRGIRQCMNLKSPHLVTIFDVKFNAAGTPFVIMEYVSGPSLAELLAESPGGLGEQKAAFFLREIAKGLSFLHEGGIVHRDLKPSNIFYENGYVKVGDYGLSKAMATSAASAQTITVGTVHYMAPEVGSGCYDRSIDIYALGVILYEMLTGQVPFFGASPAEILMKHMTQEPDLKGVGEPFARVVRKALSKEAGQRYQTVQELVEDVFGSEAVRNSMSQFSPASLSAMAARAAEKARVQPASPRGTGPAEGRGEARPPRREEAAGAAGTLDSNGAADPLIRRQRRILTASTILATAWATAVLSGRQGYKMIGTGVAASLMIAAAYGTIIRLRRRGIPHLEDNKVFRRLALGAPAAIAAMVGSLPAIMLGLARDREHDLAPCWLAIGIVLCVMDWRGVSAAERRQRLSLVHALLAAVLGLVAATIFGAAVPLVMGVAAGVSLAVQVASPFDAGARARRAGSPFGSPANYQPNREEGPGTPIGRQAGAQGVPPGPVSWPRSSAWGVRLVPAGIRLLWLLFSLVFLGAGLGFLIWAGMVNMPNREFAAGVGIGLSGLLGGLICLMRVLVRRFAGWYRYLIRPIVLWVLATSGIVAATHLGIVSMPSDETLIAALFLVLPGLLFLAVLFVPARLVEEAFGGVPAAFDRMGHTVIPQGENMVSPCKRVWALILCAGTFTLLNGLQRFYVGKIGTGVVWLLTGGLLGIGQIIDVILILAGRFTDKSGRRLLIWADADELQAASASAAGWAQPVGAPEPAVSADPPAAAAPPAPVYGEQKYEGPAPLRSERAGTWGPSWRNLPWEERIEYIRARRRERVADLFCVLGGLLVLGGLVMGAAAALHVGWFVAAGFPDPGLARKMQEVFGYAGWPVAVERLGMGAAVVTMTVAAVFLIIGRRYQGGRHMIRAALGLLGLVIGLLTFAEVLPVHGGNIELAVNAIRQNQAGAALELLTNRFDQGSAVAAALVFIVSIVVLAWPPRRPQRSAGSPPPAVERGYTHDNV